MENTNKRSLVILSIGQSVCSCVANIIHQCIPPIVKAAYNASIAWYVMSLAHFITVITAPVGARVSHHIGIINTMRVYCWLFSAWAIVWLFAKDPTRALIPMILFIYTWHGFKMMEAYVTHTSTKKDGGQSFWRFQSIAGVWILWATLIYPTIRWDIFPIVPIMTIWAMLCLFIITFFIKQDTWVIDNEETPKKVGHQYLKNAFIVPIQKWFHFTKVNHRYPIFYLWYAFFRWFVYTSLLFLIPLHLMDVKSGGFIEWLPLGIYELLVIVFGWVIWVLADKIDWRAFNIIWWWLIICGFIGMIFWNDTWWLIILWFVTWMWRNIMYSASTHVLAKHNIDRKEDPDFTAFQRSLLKVWSVSAPLILWPIYQWWWFTAWITTLSILMCFVWVTMIIRTWKLPKFEEWKVKVV